MPVFATMVIFGVLAFSTGIYLPDNTCPNPGYHEPQENVQDMKPEQ